MKIYSVKEMFLSLQGEGANTGRLAVFCRFAGCDLACPFCDTDFVGTDGDGGGRFASLELAERAWNMLPDDLSGGVRPLVILTGGEPMLQVDGPLVDALHREGFAVAIETHGGIPVPPSVDWITVSPKAGAPLVQRTGQELKLVYPQEGAEPARYVGLGFLHFYLQPMDGPEVAENTRAAVRYCLDHPRWRLSLQTHKLLGLR